MTLGTEDGWRRTIEITDAVDLTRGGLDIALSDLKVGDEVRFAQTSDDDGTFTVTDLAVVVPTIRGTVSDVTARGFRITTRDGSVWTVSVDGSTAYKSGIADGTLADVTAGATAIVAGTTRRDGSSLTVHVDGDAAYRVAGVGETASLSDTAVDMQIGISGRARADDPSMPTPSRPATSAAPVVAASTGPGRADGALDDPTIDGGSTDGALAPTS